MNVQLSLIHPAKFAPPYRVELCVKVTLWFHLQIYFAARQIPLQIFIFVTKGCVYSTLLPHTPSVLSVAWTSVVRPRIIPTRPKVKWDMKAPLFGTLTGYISTARRQATLSSHIGCGNGSRTGETSSSGIFYNGACNLACISWYFIWGTLSFLCSCCLVFMTGMAQLFFISLRKALYWFYCILCNELLKVQIPHETYKQNEMKFYFSIEEVN